ncbi:MAG: hypothetical protein ED559_13605 [Phycisphaera sp.]|nr:MAG: hypothetical protein ED559_13605 [Phycisphaera sp.]
MDTLRIGCVSYLNTVPLIEGLDDLKEAELVRAVPSRLIPMLQNNEVDVALVSLIDAARSSVPMSVLPAGMIGSDGPTLTVRLYSQVPIDQISRVHADTDSHTSVVLARLLLAELHGLTPEFIDYDAREQIPVIRGADLDDPASGEWPETLLLIGDKVVTGSPPAVRYPHQLDLGEAWKELTGLPFVYAVWMCRSDRTEDPSVAAASAILDRQRRHNRTRIDAIVSARAPEHRWPVDLARKYIGSCLLYEYDARAQKAAERFIEMCASRGLVERAGLVHASPAITTS